MVQYKLHEMPDIHKKGKRTVYPKLSPNRQLSTEEFIKAMHSYQRAIDPSVIQAVMLDMADVMQKMLANGYSVKIDGMGTFSMAIGFADKKPTEIVNEEDAMAYRKVKVKDVNFKAAPEMLKELKRRAKFDRETSGVKVLKRQTTSREERIAKALEIIEKKGMMTLTDYFTANNMSKTSASLELNEICSEPDSLITTTGKGCHKVWVKKLE